MKIRNHATARQFTAEDALDRATLEFPELTFDRRSEATRIFNRSVVTLMIKHNSTAIYRGGVQSQGFMDDDRHFDRVVDVMTEELLKRALPDLTAWRTANPVPAPKDIASDPIKFSPEVDTGMS